MDFHSVVEWLTPDRLAALLVLALGVSVMFTAAKAVAKTLCTVLAILALIYFVEPSLYENIVQFAQTEALPAAKRVFDTVLAKMSLS